MNSVKASGGTGWVAATKFTAMAKAKCGGWTVRLCEFEHGGTTRPFILYTTAYAIAAYGACDVPEYAQTWHEGFRGDLESIAGLAWDRCREVYTVWEDAPIHLNHPTTIPEHHAETLAVWKAMTSGS